jgi:hypothetical protein
MSRHAPQRIKEEKRMSKSFVDWRTNARHARRIGGQLPTAAIDALRQLTTSLDSGAEFMKAKKT